MRTLTRTAAEPDPAPPPRQIRLRIAIGTVIAAVVISGGVTAIVAGNDQESHNRATLPGLGFYPGYAKVSAFTALEAWLDGASYVVQFADVTAAHFDPSVWGAVVKEGGFQTLSDRVTLVESIPLVFGWYVNTSTQQDQAQVRTRLQTTVSGAYDAKYRQAATYLRDAGFDDAVLRLGWEFDGDWMPWSSRDNCELFQRVFRHVHDIFASVSPTFRFDWNGTSSYLAAGAQCAWPGDKYVDIVGLDYYDKGLVVGHDPATNTWADPAAAFDDVVLPNLEAQRDFAIVHGKPVSYPEWALAGGSAQVVGGGDDPAFVEGMYHWMRGLPATGPGSLAYESYFNEDVEDGNHVLRHFPCAQARYRQLFGR